MSSTENKACENYRSFIGYRCKADKPYLAPSEDVAGLIWWWIENETEAKNYSPALFEQCHYSHDISFVSDIDNIMKCVGNAFFVICPDFFKEVISQHKKNSTELYKKNIYYCELKSALDKLETKNIHLIYVKHDGRTLIEEEDEPILNDIFGDKWKNLRTLVNNSITFDYDEIQNEFRSFNWNSANDNARSNLVERVSTNYAAKKFKSAFMANFIQKTEQTTEFYNKRINDIKDDLRRCALTIPGMQLPREHGEFKAGTSPEDDCKIIYDDPVEILTNGDGRHRLAKCMVDEFRNYRNEFQLPSDKFGYWDVDLDSKSNLYKGISVCAVCFGLLILQHNITKYSRTVNNRRVINQPGLELQRERSINLLIALRNPITKTWPTLWGSPEDRIYVDGTVTQTTLSLSALLICGFLSTENNITTEALKNRCEFIWESTNALLNGKQNGYDTNICCWGHKFNCPGDQPTSLAFTAYAFETLIKTKSTLLGLIDYFETKNNEYAQTLSGYIEQINNNFKKISLYFVDAVRDDYTFSSNFVDAVRDDYTSSSSITHTALVVKALMAFSNSQIEETLGETKEEIDSLLSKVVPKLIELVEKKEKCNKKHLDIEEHERFEVPKDMVRTPGTDGIDQYEHCAELIVAETLIKIAESEQYREYKERATVCLEWILDTYMEGAAKFLRENDKVLIRSSNDNFKYPIFYLYYYRMVLMDYLLFTNGINDDKNKEKQS